VELLLGLQEPRILGSAPRSSSTRAALNFGPAGAAPVRSRLLGYHLPLRACPPFLAAAAVPALHLPAGVVGEKRLSGGLAADIHYKEIHFSPNTHIPHLVCSNHQALKPELLLVLLLLLTVARQADRLSGGNGSGPGWPCQACWRVNSFQQHG